MPLQEPQDGGVALNARSWTGGGKRARDPRIAVGPIDPENLCLVHADFGGRHGVDAVVIPNMREHVLGGGFVDHPIFETLEIDKRLGVALPGCPGVTPDNLIETPVPGHEQASSVHPRPPATRCLEDGLQWQ
jgi:hypothetical protein